MLSTRDGRPVPNTVWGGGSTSPGDGVQILSHRTVSITSKSGASSILLLVPGVVSVGFYFQPHDVCAARRVRTASSVWLLSRSPGSRFVHRLRRLVPRDTELDALQGADLPFGHGKEGAEIASPMTCSSGIRELLGSPRDGHEAGHYLPGDGLPRANAGAPLFPLLGVATRPPYSAPRP